MKEISFDELSEETKRKIQQIQIYEQNFQQILLEKKALLMEKEEIEDASKEIEKTDGEVFKILAGRYVLKSTKSKLIGEIKHKIELFSLRIKNLEKQEEEYLKKTESLRQEIIKEINDTKI